MIITAKFASKCPCCPNTITPGIKVEWSKGSPARHVTCAVTHGATTTDLSQQRTLAQSRGRRSGTWTGCSCGSRKDSYGDLIPSGTNCASCEHDA